MNIARKLDQLVAAEKDWGYARRDGKPVAAQAALDKSADLHFEIADEFDHMRKERNDYKTQADQARAGREKLRQLVVAATDLAQEFSRNLGTKEDWAAAWKAKAKEYRKRNSDLCDEVEQLMWDSVGG